MHHVLPMIAMGLIETCSIRITRLCDQLANQYAITPYQCGIGEKPLLPTANQDVGQTFLSGSKKATSITRTSK